MRVILFPNYYYCLNALFEIINPFDTVNYYFVVKFDYSNNYYLKLKIPNFVVD